MDAAYAKYKGNNDGAVADYIPALAKVDPKVFGIAVVTADGKVYTAGDLKTEVSIQSISKVFTMALVMDQQSPDADPEDHRRRRDRYAVQLDRLDRMVVQGPRRVEARERGGNESARQSGRHHRHQHGGQGKSRDEIWGSIANFYNAAAGRQLTVLDDVYDVRGRHQPAEPGHRHADVRLRLHQDNPLQAVDIYTRQCSVGVNAKDLAMMAAMLAFGGTNPVTNKQVMKSADVPEVLAVMATAACMTTPASGCSTPACPPRAAWAAASSPSRRASSASP